VLQFGSQNRRALGTYQCVEVLAVKDGKKGPPAGDKYCRLCFAPQRTPGIADTDGKKGPPPSSRTPPPLRLEGERQLGSKRLPDWDARLTDKRVHRHPPRPLQPLRVGFGFPNGAALALSPIFGVSMAVRASAAASPTAPKRFKLGSPPLVRIWGC
jgi:hypothetical protein